jgi:VWFA-related protein
MALQHRSTGQWANLETAIRTRLHRDVADEDVLLGRAPTGFSRAPGRGLRLSKAVIAGLALAAVAGLAGLRAGWGQTDRGMGGSGGGATQSSGAATPAQAAQGSVAPTLRVTTRETVVDVSVTDDKGRPVHDLKQSDFTVKEDGQPQPVRSFLEVREDAPPEARPAPQLPPNVYTNLQPAPTTSAVNILLLDGLNTLPADQVNMRQESIKYLKSMPRGTRIAVLGLSSSLRILQGFTSDPTILVAVADSKKNRALPSPFIDNDTGAILDDQADQQTELGNDDLAATIQQFENEQDVEQQDVRNRMTLEALDQIAAYVAGIKGRKNLVWFTDGMPLDLFPTGGINDLQGMTDYAKEVRKTTDLLTAAEVAVYPVDARKLFNVTANEADQHLERITKNTGAIVATKQMAAQDKKSGQLLGMEAVAEATGGAAYYNTNDLKSAVAKAIDNGANYYTVSYTPPDLNFDGRYHSINVQVDRPGLHPAYRKGYNADDILHDAVSPALSLATSTPEPFGNNMVASMGRGVPTSSQVLFSVSVVPKPEPLKPADATIMGTLDPRLKDKPLVRYAIQYSLPSRQVTFSENPDGTRRCSLEFDLAAYDVFGKRISGLSQTISPRPITPEQYQQTIKTPFRFLQQLDIPPGEVFLRVGVLDAVSDRAGTLEIPLVVSKKLARTAAPPGGTNGH